MELEEIIYIVGTIIIFAVSLLGKKKKKKNPIIENNDTEQVEYSLNDFEKILEREHIVEEQEIEEYKDETNKIEEEQIDNVPKNYHFTKDEYSKKEERKEKEKEIFEDNDEDNEDGFDLKSAIVYSSILERKKYRH